MANAVVRSAHKMFILGVANGQTTIFALDKAGHQLATLELTVGRDTSELMNIYRTALPGYEFRVGQPVAVHHHPHEHEHRR